MAYTGSVPDTAARRSDWQEQAACRTGDPDLFFNPDTEHEARTICVARCPVRLQCLAAVKAAEQGLHRDDRDGVVAGLTGNERWRLDETGPRRLDDAPPLQLTGAERCGTHLALLRHLWQGERIDGVCWSGQVKRDHDQQTAAKAS
ncbi:WhiB family transcriptional regulator [Streptomyces sp. NPDC014776]|uniref:WhiB family transcriptional regulator n=1 Tax=unclassified Streptomyces TaxID=2593676 RepID=UPI0036F6487B